MKKVIMMLCLVALITGCNKGKSRQITSEEPPKEASSIYNVEQLKAIGDINFFITEELYEKEKALFLKSVHNPESDKEYSVALQYKLGEYEFLRMDGYFSNDSLYYNSLIGFVFSDNFDYDFPKQYNALYNLLVKKYGEPTEKTQMPSRLLLITEKEIICCLWELGNKNIIIKAEYNGKSYFVNMESFRIDIVNQMHRNIQRESIESIERDIDKI